MIPQGLLPESSLWLALCIMLPWLLFAIKGINWSILSAHKTAQHIFFLSVLVLAGFWHFDAGLLPGLHFHILGLTAITLMMGWRLALLVGLFVQIILVVSGKLWWAAVPVQWLTSVLVPVLSSYTGWWIVNRCFPHNPFVYIILACFFNAVLAQAITNLAEAAVLVTFDIYSFEKVWDNYLYLLPLMLFPEGVINGMFITCMVVFHSKWLSTFDAESHFN